MFTYVTTHDFRWEQLKGKFVFFLVFFIKMTTGVLVHVMFDKLLEAEDIKTLNVS